MSLKYFHLVFIALSFLVMAGFGFWAVTASDLDGGLRFMGFISILAGCILLYYGIRFYKKASSIII